MVYKSIILITKDSVLSPSSSSHNNEKTQGNQKEGQTIKHGGAFSGPSDRTPHSDNLNRFVVYFLISCDCLHSQITHMFLEIVSEWDNSIGIWFRINFTYFQRLGWSNTQNLEIWVWTHCLSVNILQIGAIHPEVANLGFALRTRAHNSIEFDGSFAGVDNFIFENSIFARLNFLGLDLGALVVHLDGEQSEIISHVHLHVQGSNLRSLDVEVELGVLVQSSCVLEFSFLERVIVESVAEIRRTLVTLAHCD